VYGGVAVVVAAATLWSQLVVHVLFRFAASIIQ
jgi:hypothetical protein